MGLPRPNDQEVDAESQQSRTVANPWELMNIQGPLPVDIENGAEGHDGANDITLPLLVLSIATVANIITFFLTLSMLVNSTYLEKSSPGSGAGFEFFMPSPISLSVMQIVALVIHCVAWCKPSHRRQGPFRKAMVVNMIRVTIMAYFVFAGPWVHPDAALWERIGFPALLCVELALAGYYFYAAC